MRRSITVRHPLVRARTTLPALAFTCAGIAVCRADPGPLLQVNVASDRHAISPLIYGLNSYDVDPVFAAEVNLPVSRWGGDATSRYNWQADGSNAGNDWYFMAGGTTTNTPSGSADAFINVNRSEGAATLLTIPVIGYVNSAVAVDCSFPVSLFGQQQSVNPYTDPIVDGQQTQAGNGVLPNGTDIVLTTAQILRINAPNSPSLQQGWLQHLIAKYGTAAKGGVAIYQMDNEPSGWSNTHRDIQPVSLTYPQLVAQTIPYAAMVKATDPTATVDGPGDYGWAAYLPSSTTPGGLWNAQYYLQQMSAYQIQHGVRLLDYFDEHYYPTTNTGVGSIALSTEGDSTTQALRLLSTRSLWDPTYVENDWIGQYYGAIDLIPRMRQWVAQYYPGTKIAITEYNWGGLESMNGALTQADVLGIFGREGLGMATMWGSPTATQPGANAFLLYRNYDGAGSTFGDTGVQATSADQDELSVYAAERSKDGELTVVVINKTATDLTSSLQVAGFPLVGSPVQVYQYSGANLSAIVQMPNQPLSGKGVSATFPANSMTLMLVAGVALPASGFTISPGTIAPGAGASANVSLNAAAPAGGAQVSIAVNGFPYATLIIPAGKTSAALPISTSTATPSGAYTFQAAYNGTTAQATLTLSPSITVESFAFAPATVKRGATARGTVTLSAPAPSGGEWVWIFYNDFPVTSLDIAGGKTTGSFSLPTQPGMMAGTYPFDATVGGSSAAADLVVTN